MLRATLFCIPFILSLFTNVCSGIDTLYLDNQYSIANVMSAEYMALIYKKGDRYQAQLRDLEFKNIHLEGAFKDKRLEVRDGYFEFYYDNGKKESEGMYVEGKKSGLWKRWDWMGHPKPDRFYNEVVRPEVIASRYVQTQFPGGEQALEEYIRKHMNYPRFCILNEIEGEVQVTFTVDHTGLINDIGIFKGTNVDLDTEAMRVVSTMPEWEPATMDGETVRTSYVLPIQFTLDDRASY